MGVRENGPNHPVMYMTVFNKHPSYTQLEEASVGATIPHLYAIGQELEVVGEPPEDVIVSASLDMRIRLYDLKM